MAPISIPTTAQLPGSLRLPTNHPIVVKLLSRLSRPSLLDLAIQWMNQADAGDRTCAPYLRALHHDDESMYPASPSLDALLEVYHNLRRVGSKASKREVVDRILEGDWRPGLTLHQLAMADMLYLADHPLSQKWTAFRIATLKPAGAADEDGNVPLEVDKTTLIVPRFHPPSFIRNLQSQLPADIKTHCAFERHATLPLLLLRIFIFETPYSNNLVIPPTQSGDDPNRTASKASTTFDATRTVYVAFPDASPHVYISNAAQVTSSTGAAAASEARSLRALVVEAIPQALSRPRERYTLKSTSLSTKNMAELVARRGGGRSDGAAGGWGIYADESRRESPLDSTLPSPPLSEGEEVRKRKMETSEEKAAKRRRLIARARFGDSAKIDDGLGVEKVDIAIHDPFPSAAAVENGDGEAEPERTNGVSDNGTRSKLDAAFQREAALRGGDDDEDDNHRSATSRPKWCPGIKITFQGPHVFAGIRQLVEAGVIDGEKMPGWMTGEEGVTIGAVKNGRIRGHKGSGL